MLQTCTRCSRLNPAEAAFCYYDGIALPGHRRNGTAATGSRFFPRPFVFPSGRSCRSFDELALACQEDWAGAKQALQQGTLEKFLASIGRSDLALAAREAMRYPDRDRGLDQFLATLPTEVLDPPRLRVEPAEINLGTLPVGEDRRFDLHLQNQGMRLLYGTASCGDHLWLGLGDAPGAPEKLFQLTGEMIVPVHVRGRHLRAGPKPLAATLTVESNGGTGTVTVKVEVPVKPFPGGVLAGAVTPRQVAEKAKAHPKEAARLFENGAVARWYEDNGWTYPIQGPAASGLGAVQQFFEALGLTPAPKVDVSERAVTLRGSPGHSLKHALEVRAEEKRPVYAHARSNQPWLEVGRPKLNGRTATIPLAIPSVPDREGETLTAKVFITANGNQRFVVPVALIIGGSLILSAALPAAVDASEEQALENVTETALPRAERTPGQRLGLHWLPAALLAAIVLAAVAFDFFAPRGAESGGVSSDKEWGAAALKLSDADPRIGIQFSEKMRFGLVMLKARDPKYPAKHKKLTFQEDGGSNNTCVRLDGFDNLFGQPPGKWKQREARDREGRRTKSVWHYLTENVLVTQFVELVPGEQTGVLDTCLVRYVIENQSKVGHTVGLRVMLDTFIGAEDGVPFAVPGQAGLLETAKEFSQKEIPDFIQVLERPSLSDPGTVAHVGLKLAGADLEPMEKMLVCRWPGNSEARWLIEPAPMNEPPENKDSCVVLYWMERTMAPGEKRQVAFTYGLNTISSLGKENAQLSLTVGGSFRPKGQFTVTAYVKNPQKDQRVKLGLPEGLTLLPGQDAEQVVDRSGSLSQVSWKVRAGDAGKYVLEVSSGLEREAYPVQIRASSIFD